VTAVFVNCEEFVKMEPVVKVFANVSEMAEELAEEFRRHTEELSGSNKIINIAISGGMTPLYFYRRLANYNSISLRKINWKKIHVFWVDERCVPATYPDSNFGLANRLFLRTVDIPAGNIHRIKGENIPADEAIVYSDILRLNVPLRNSYPSFDWIFLGLGEDGHVASIFPDQMKLLFSDKYCETAVHPRTKQNRITLTGKVLINARRITFIVSGENKKKVVREIIKKEPVAKVYPASYIKSVGGRMEWYLDKLAASILQ
jgi:6-phosphogluconolactonase